MRLLLVFCVFVSSSLFATETAAYNGAKINLFELGLVLENKQQSLGLSDALALPADQWTKPESPNFDATFSDSEFWFRAPLGFLTDKTAHYQVVAEMPVQDYIDLWFIHRDGSILAAYETGDQRPLENRPIKNRHFAFPVPTHDPADLEVVLRLTTQDGMFEAGPLVVQTSESLAVSNQLEFLLYGMLYGGLLWIGGYNLLLYLSHRDLRFLKYAGYVTSFLIFHFSFRGFAAIYWWTDNAWLINQMKPISVIFVYLMLYVFGTDMLNTRAKYPLSHRAYQILIATLAVPLILALNGSVALTYRYLSPQALMVLFGMAYFAIRGSISGDYVSRIFLAAWGVLLVSTVIYIFRLLGWVAPSFWVYHAVDIGVGIEALLLAFALGEKLNRLASEKDASNLKLLASTWELNHSLEEKVEARTQELQNANRELTLANLKLQEVSNKDPLTNLYNRRQFPARLKAAITQSSRSGTRLVFHLIDIDLFKKLNDSAGHEQGDAALKQFSELLTSHWARDTDNIYRIGGEEFGIFHSANPDSDIDGHLQRFMDMLAEENIYHPNGIEQRLTCSIGSVACYCEKDTTLELVVRHADKAMYWVKENGRNGFRCETLSPPNLPPTSVE